MESTIIGQGYNIAEDTSVAKELINLFNSARYDSFTCLVAFASLSGVSALTPYILENKTRGMEIRIILGVDQKGTSREALEEVFSWGVDSFIFHTASANIFHPKIYLFENRDIFSLIVGSNNLTEMGLVKNIECSLMIKDIRSNPVHADLYKYWKGILDGTDINLYPLTPPLIESLVADGLVVSESVRAAIHDNPGSPDSIQQPRNIQFNTTTIQRRPAGFSPKRLLRVRANSSAAPRLSIPVGIKAPQPGQEIDIPVADEVLIAEIGKGTRWKQVNFPIRIFEDFFGATRGDNSYTIELTPLLSDGTLGETEVRQAVTVKSNNFRIEISCDRDYPASGNGKPIGLFAKISPTQFIYTVLMPDDAPYDDIRAYLYRESKPRKPNELHRHIAHIEAVHALYPDFTC